MTSDWVKPGSMNRSALHDQYDTLQKHGAVLPPFDEWLRQIALVSAATPAGTNDAQDDMLAFKVIESLITGLQSCGYSLSHTLTAEPTEAVTLKLAQLLVRDLHAPAYYLKRIHDLLTYYHKQVDDQSDAIRQKEVDRVTTNLQLAYRDLVQRSSKALDHLTEDRAIGRAEGALAMLVSAGALDRHAAQRESASFKQLARDLKKNV